MCLKIQIKYFINLNHKYFPRRSQSVCTSCTQLVWLLTFTRCRKSYFEINRNIWDNFQNFKISVQKVCFHLFMGNEVGSLHSSRDSGALTFIVFRTWHGIYWYRLMFCCVWEIFVWLLLIGFLFISAVCCRKLILCIIIVVSWYN